MTAPADPNSMLEKIEREMKTKIASRPWLRLCSDCNRRAAAAGDEVASTVGIEVCLECAKAIDSFNIRMKQHTTLAKQRAGRRTARNVTKRARRARRAERRR